MVRAVIWSREWRCADRLNNLLWIYINPPMRIAITYNVLRQRTDEEIDFDRQSTIHSLQKALQDVHEVVAIECTRDIPGWIRSLLDFEPDFVFNFAAGFPSAARESFFPALYEQLGIPYFGSDPATMLICHNKGLTNRIVAAAGIRAPRSLAIASLEEFTAMDRGALRFPMIVKPNSEAWGLGLDRSSVVRDYPSLTARLGELLQRFRGIAVCEEFIPRGEDVSMSFVEGLGEEVFGPVVYDYDRSHELFSYEVKSQQYDESILKFPHSITADVEACLKEAMGRAVLALDIRGYARADFRLDPAGNPYFIEMNSRTEVMPDRSDFFAPLRRAGYSYEQVVRHMVEFARSNCHRKRGVAGLREHDLITSLLRKTASAL